MKICFIVSVYPRFHEDSEVPWLRKTVNLLRDAGHEIVIYAPSYHGIGSHTIDGCPVKRFRYFFAPFETLTHDEGAPNKIHRLHYKIITLFYLFFGTVGLIRFHRKEKFDLLHVHWPAPHALFSYCASLLRKTRIVLHFYTADIMLLKRFPFVKKILRFFVRSADEVIAISTFSADLVRNMCQRQIHIIPYGITITPRTEAPPFSPNHSLLSVGRMIERKGFDYLIGAMPAIIGKWPDARLTIAGGGPLRDRLIEQAKSLGVEYQVTLPGKVPQEELERLFAECHVFILSSIIDSKGDTEGLGVVLIEAMAYCKPVIATNIGGIVDIVEHEKTGLLVPQRDAGAIAGAVDRIFTDNNLATTLGADGADYVQKQFAWHSVIERFNAVYSLFE